MSFNIPNTFVAGTKARADEVNENFESVRDELNKCTLNLAEVKEEMDFIKTQTLDDFISEAEMMVKTQKSKFCVNYSNLAQDNVSPDILSAADNILSFKVGSKYPVLVGTNAFGDSETFEYIDDVDISGYADGTYNVFLTLSGGIELFNTKLFRTPKEPTGVIINDIWLMTLEPWACYKFNGLSWMEYEGIPLGKVTISNGVIKTVTNNPFNTQYIDADCAFITQSAREGLSKRFESEWFETAPKGTYTFEHNLDINPLHYRVRLVARVKENFGNFLAGDIIETLYSNYGGNEANVEAGCILKMNNNSITLGVGNSSYFCANDFGLNGYNFIQRSNLEYKIIVTRDVN